MRRHREEGAVVPLVIGLFTIAVAFVAVAAAATSLHLDRLRLLTIADGAALAGAESFRVADVAVRGDRVVPALSAARVRETADAYVAEADPGDLDGLAVVRAGADAAGGATVVLTATWRPPLVSALLPAGVPITVASTAAARFR